MLRPNIIRPVYRGVGHQSGTRDQIFFFLKHLLTLSRLLTWGALSDERLGLWLTVKSQALARISQKTPLPTFPPFLGTCLTVKEEISRYNSHYGDRLRTHPNHLAVNLLRLNDNRRLRRFLPTDLPDRF
jgi:hypothetical protein